MATPLILSSLPCYTERAPPTFQTARYGRTTIMPPRLHFNLRNNIPFDTNYSCNFPPGFDLPMGTAPDTRGTYINHAARPQLPSDYVAIPYTVQSEYITPVSACFNADHRQSLFSRFT